MFSFARQLNIFHTDLAAVDEDRFGRLAVQAKVSVDCQGAVMTLLGVLQCATCAHRVTGLTRVHCCHGCAGSGGLEHSESCQQAPLTGRTDAKQSLLPTNDFDRRLCELLSENGAVRLCAMPAEWDGYYGEGAWAADRPVKATLKACSPPYAPECVEVIDSWVHLVEESPPLSPAFYEVSESASSRGYVSGVFLLNRQQSNESCSERGRFFLVQSVVQGTHQVQGYSTRLQEGWYVSQRVVVFIGRGCENLLTSGKVELVPHGLIQTVPHTRSSSETMHRRFFCSLFSLLLCPFFLVDE